MEEEIKKCPGCGGKMKMMFGLMRKCQCFAQCTNCHKEYDLPTVKAKILKNLKISKATYHKAIKAWNKRVSNMFD